MGGHYLEDARHRMGLLQYNLSTVSGINGGGGGGYRALAHCIINEGCLVNTQSQSRFSSLVDANHFTLISYNNLFLSQGGLIQTLHISLIS